MRAQQEAGARVQAMAGSRNPVGPRRRGEPLARSARQRLERLERRAGRQRVLRRGLVGRQPEEDPLDRDLELLARQRARDRRHRDGSRRGRGAATAPSRRAAVDRARAGRRRASAPSREDDEQQQLARAAARVLEVHDEAVGDLAAAPRRPRRTRAVPEAHAAAVERRVAAAGDHARAAVGDRDPVAVAPDAGPRLEVGGAHPRAVGVAPEADRHRRHRRGDHELALLADDAAGPSGSNASTRAPSIRQLISPAQTGTSGDGPRNAGAQVGAAAERAELDRRPRRASATQRKPGRRQRRAGRADAAQRATGRASRPRLQPGRAAGHAGTAR